MDILNLMKEFPNQESCLRFIEKNVGRTVFAVSTVAVKKLDARTETTLLLVGIATIVNLAFRLQQEPSSMVPRYLSRNGFWLSQSFPMPRKAYRVVSLLVTWT